MRPELDAERKKQFDLLGAAHGGYWRYSFADHAYLYNLYFPPQRFFDLVKDNLHALISSYPVAQQQLAQWVSDLIGQPPEYVVVGNGAAELIKIVSAHVASSLIVPVPSFNEYANASASGAVEEFPLEYPSFQLDVAKFAAAARRCKAEVAVVVSPNNPTSLLVPKDELRWLVSELNKHGCMLIVDESFIDFSDQPERHTLEPEIERYSNLVIFKSMSKAYGICGIRIGYMLTANSDFARKVRTNLPIWNLNGIAETFLEESVSYRAEFAASCARVRAERDAFYLALCGVEGMLAYRPQANYVFCRVPDAGPSGAEIAERLYIEHDIYLKHCSGKSMPEAERYLRIASRTAAENAALVTALIDVVKPISRSVAKSA